MSGLPHDKTIDMAKLVEIESSKIKKLVKYFNEVAAICDELVDVYEYDGLDEELRKMKDWVKENFPE